jgi:NitT/TauT family transport system ATP-binding protein
MSVSGNGSLLELRGVGKEYAGGGRACVAVRNVDLTIRPGEFVGLLGPSGCGKSTLLRIITGLTPATSGRVLYRGEPLVGINPHATIVFQTFALYPWLTVQENVEIALKARGLPPDDRRVVALRLIDLVGLDGFESAYPRELSGGMRQKVGFARAMAVEPELLCLDEPFSALDVLSAEALRNELLELWLGKSIPTQAILLVTHNIEEAVLLADRLIIMGKDPGRVLAEMPVGLRYPRHRKDTAFMATLDKVYALVSGPAKPETGAAGTGQGQPLLTKRLPSARINGLAGLMEKVAEEGGRADLHRIGSGLHLELDDLLPVMEAAQLLGFAQVDSGDILLTPLGQAFADASIPARKEIIAGRLLRHPTIRWIYETLQEDDDRRVAESYFLERLQTEFGENAPAQLEIAINWARYAELFAFDDDTDDLFLES